MKTLTLQQGSPEWLAHRRTVRNASDAPAMMGASPYVSRADLIRQRATGIEREIDAATQARFDRGHEVEPALRSVAESTIGEDLYPATCVSDDGYLGASFDGVTMLEDTILEAKQHNAEKVACIERGEIPSVDYWQIVQQFAVCESAQRCLYLVGDGTADRTARLEIPRASIEADIPKLLAGWRQFDADVAAYEPEPTAAPPVAGRAPDQLPSLSIQVTGMVKSSNLAEFRENALAVLGSINRDLQTDEDFANAEQTVKWCKGVEERLEATKQQVLGQTADIDAVFRTMDEVSAETRRIRLELDKLVSREKDNRKTDIVQGGVRAVREHFAAINATMGEHALAMPATLTADIGAVIKGKKSLTSMRDAVDAAVAQHKVAASQAAERVRVNVAILAEHQDHASLFADRVQLCASKAPDDLRNLVTARVAEHKRREDERLEQERARIRQEEADRLERERAEQAAADSSHGIATAGGVPDSGEVPDRVRRLTGSGSHVQGAGTLATDGPTTAAAASTARIKLGDINAAIAPLSITADGLTSLGFTPVARRGAAQLYPASDFHRICAALAQAIDTASARGIDFSEAA